MAKWVVAAKKADFNRIAQKYQIDPVLARVIRNRDVVTDEEIEQYLHGTLRDIPAPELLKDVQKAADLIAEKIKRKKKIRVIGDYDIDGVCASYILVRGLDACGALVDEVIPHRIRDGYGLNDSLILQAWEDGIDTILTCDNGIAAGEQIRLAKEKGMTVIVTDHHEVPYEESEEGDRRECLPPADAVIDPKQKACAYPFDGICGAAVAYKFLQVLFQRYPGKETLLEDFLEFAAFATIGDVMELIGENRILVKQGLKMLEQTKNAGMRALLEVNQLSGKRLSAYHIGFVLGPCLNATGRLDTAERALSMFLTSNPAEAAAIAAELKELNDSRKDMTRQQTIKAVEKIEGGACKQDSVLVVYLEDCHESLAGIIAGRLKERYHKPVFVLTDAEEGVKGSGRSIESYSMYERMSECKELYTKYGGHKMAAGVSMPKENVEKFRSFLNEHSALTEEDFEEKLVIDAAMPMSYVTKALVRQLSLLEPFGNGNSKPVFAQRNLCFLQGKILGKNGNVGKYQVRDEQGMEFEMIYFGDLEKWHDFLTEEYGAENFSRLYQGRGGIIHAHITYYPDINSYRGVEKLQMVMQDYCAVSK